MKYLYSILIVVVLGTVTVASTPEVTGEANPDQITVPVYLEVNQVGVISGEVKVMIESNLVVFGVCCYETRDVRPGYSEIRYTYDNGLTSNWVMLNPNSPLPIAPVC